MGGVAHTAALGGSPGQPTGFVLHSGWGGGGANEKSVGVLILGRIRQGGAVLAVWERHKTQGREGSAFLLEIRVGSLVLDLHVEYGFSKLTGSAERLRRSKKSERSALYKALRSFFPVSRRSLLETRNFIDRHPPGSIQAQQRAGPLRQT